MARAFILWPVLAGGLAVINVSADVIKLRAAEDTTLFQTSPKNNLGANATLVVGTTAQGMKSRALIRFELSTNLPPGAIIQTATVRVEVVKAPSTLPVSSTFDLRRVLVDWGEGKKSDSPAGTNEASWVARFAPSNLWSAPGGSVGTDYSPTMSAKKQVGGPGTYNFVSTSNLVADVQFWVDHPESNLGWVLMTESEITPKTARRIASREAGSSGPTLSIQYLSPCRITNLILGPTNGVIVWEGGQAPFQLQQKSDLIETNWSSLGPLLQTNTASFPLLPGRSFFRVSSPGPAP
jgi:hypothetical protein